MKILEILFPTICILLMLVGFLVIEHTGNETLAILIGLSGIGSLGYWLASDFI